LSCLTKLAEGLSDTSPRTTAPIGISLSSAVLAVVILSAGHPAPGFTAPSRFDVYAIDRNGRLKCLGNAGAKPPTDIPEGSTWLLSRPADLTAAEVAPFVAEIRALAAPGVKLSRPQITDALLARLVEIPSLRVLYLEGYVSGQVGLEVLRRAKELHLRIWSFSQSQRPDLRRLSQLDNLKQIDLDDTNAADQDLAQLSPSSRLEVLRLNGTKVTDRGMAHLRTLEHLRVLDLDGTHVTEKGIAELAGLARLEQPTREQMRMWHERYRYCGGPGPRDGIIYCPIEWTAGVSVGGVSASGMGTSWRAGVDLTIGSMSFPGRAAVPWWLSLGTGLDDLGNRLTVQPYFEGGIALGLVALGAGGSARVRAEPVQGGPHLFIGLALPVYGFPPRRSATFYVEPYYRPAFLWGADTFRVYHEYGVLLKYLGARTNYEN
jgi:hypothetical protein